MSTLDFHNKSNRCEFLRKSGTNNFIYTICKLLYAESFCDVSKPANLLKDHKYYEVGFWSEINFKCNTKLLNVYFILITLFLKPHMKKPNLML